MVSIRSVWVQAAAKHARERPLHLRIRSSFDILVGTDAFLEKGLQILPGVEFVDAHADRFVPGISLQVAWREIVLETLMQELVKHFGIPRWMLLGWPSAEEYDVSKATGAQLDAIASDLGFPR